MSTGFENMPGASSGKKVKVPDGIEQDVALPEEERDNTQAEQEEPPASRRDEGDESLLVFARQFNEDPRQFIKRPDFLTVLDLAEKGFLAHLTIEIPRFSTDILPEELGLKFTKKADRLMQSYVRLGKRDLLPDSFRKELRLVEVKARECLRRHSIPTPWHNVGYFVPATKFEQWKAENAECEVAFWDLRNRILASFDEIIEQVLRDYRRLALESWEGFAVRSAMVNLVAEPEGGQGDEQAEEEFRGTLPESDQDYETVLQELRKVQVRSEKDQFIEKYIARIRSVMQKKKLLNRDDVAKAFTYEVSRFVIPLSAQLRSEKAQLQQILSDQAIEDAKHQAKLEILEKQREEEFRTIEERHRADREAYYERLRLDEQERHIKVQREQEQLEAEREQRRRQQEVDDAAYRMKQDMIREARATSVAMLRQFHDDVMGHIFAQAFSVCDEILNSIYNNGGRMTGSTSMRLKNLIQELQELNFMQDEKVEEHIAKLRAAATAPRIEYEAKDGTPYKRVDTALLGRVIDEIVDEAQDILVELGQTPERISPRYSIEQFLYEDGEDGEGVALVDQRLGAHVVSTTEDFDEEAPIPTARTEVRGDGEKKRRRRAATKEA